MTPESKKPYRRRLYQKAFFGTIAASVRWELKQEFAAACEANGTTMHAVLKTAAERYINEHAGPSA